MRDPMVFLAGLLFAAAASASAWAEEIPRYNRDVRPILADTCFQCHGPAQQKAGLRLDQHASVTSPTKTGALAIVPGKLDESELIRRIESDDENEVMPPKSSKKELTTEQREILKRWITSGGAYEKHWAFEPPKKTTPPEVVGEGPAIQHPIDRFLADRLRHDGFTMSPEADRETLIRRVAFTLTGLPPTLSEVDTFLGDTSMLAYENMVERYLNSPRYGEEMARHWLDVARYADTHGMHLDNERQMWPYRDWVVRAFNDDLRFDRFVVEQVAGDLLPNPTLDQLVATGFNRCNVTTGEGGSIDAEWYYRYAVDRATTVAEAFMGLTAGCAVCHDHKFDPISTEEFYQLYAFFYSAAGSAMDGNALLHEPTIRLANPEQKAKLEVLRKRVEEANKAVEKKAAEVSYNDPADTPAETGEKAVGPAESPAGNPFHSFKAWLAADGPTLNKQELPAAIKTLLKRKPDGTLPDLAVKRLRTYYIQNICAETRDEFQPLLLVLGTAVNEKLAIEKLVPASYVFRNMATPRDAFVMVRGQYDKPGRAVMPGTPAALPALKMSNPGGRADRLDLAHWMTSPEHPLTARVAVNRFWQQVFGTGLVKTGHDFGTQGAPPSHPELLDWLALSFREGGWDVKALMRTLVNSSAFRQSSRVTPELLKHDPENRLLGRGPRLRLDAEPIRDNALYVSGLLDLSMGGKGVRPYQPPNIWEPVAYTDSNTAKYVQDKGESLYRRSLYTFFKRTAPPPFLANFDAPNREAFCNGREHSNTPLQALQLMNDIQHVEAARHLAARMWAEGGASPKDQIAWGFRVVLSRHASLDELAVLVGQYDALLTRYRAEPAAALELLRVGESPLQSRAPETDLAALTLVANTLLNLDETVNRN